MIFRLTSQTKKLSTGFFIRLSIVLGLNLLLIITSNFSFSYYQAEFETEKTKLAEQSETGYYTLKWSLPVEISKQINKRKIKVNYRLEQSFSGDFSKAKTIYHGADSGSFISGKKENTYYYRVRAESTDGKEIGKWSTPYKVVVEYQSMILAWSLFSVGTVIFLGIIAVIVVGSRKGEA